jgi:hypothetical protein
MADGVVTFDYTGWVTAYPEFGVVAQPQAQDFFNRATLYVDNTPSSPISDLTQRAILLNMATAHMAKLFALVNGQAPGVVGRISSATEGSVSVQTVYAEPRTDVQAWWNQTTYGASFWAATLRYRAGFYVPPPRRFPFCRR